MNPSTKALRPAFVLACMTLPSAAAGQVPAGGEFRVNVVTTAGQSRPSLSLNAKGEMVVVWDSSRDGGGLYDIMGRRFDAAGAALGPEFRINTTITAVTYGASVAMDARGNFVVVWNGADGDFTGVFGQRYDASAARRGGEFQVNTFTTDGQGFYNLAGPFVSTAADGRFVVVWTSETGDGSRTSVQARRYAADGAPVGDEFRVNKQTTGRQVASSVDMADDGSFVVGFSSPQDGDGYGAIAKRYDASGGVVGSEFVVNGATAGGQYAPVVRLARDRSALIHFHDPEPDGVRILARRFDPSDSRLGAEFQVNTLTLGRQYSYSSARDAEDNFIVAWSSDYDIAARRYRADGTGRGGEFAVNTHTTDKQSYAAVASDPVGNFVVAWHSNPQDGSWYGVFAQRFGGLLPDALNMDTTGNGIWEPGESADVRPTWRNVNGAAQTFGAGLGGLTGPAGATYTLLDGTGSYGTVPSGATAPCADCYRVHVDDTSSRPVLHWDAVALESITPDTQGQQKRWVLHIGQSFTDVPSSSPFYRYVETLLHASITAGCASAQYCPGSSTTREQMSVFVLVAREGAGYLPPACTTPVFTDVPASSPFCRFIEELARRGVVGGCGPGLYCPSGAVTREQMAVFALRTFDPFLVPPDCVPPNLFDDVPESSPFCRWIEELARRGVVAGCGPDLYCPTQAVTREQMGVFISLTFGLALYGP